jgi:hypothetical protein
MTDPSPLGTSANSPRMVARADLIARLDRAVARNLDRAVARKVTIISASADRGKTSLNAVRHASGATSDMEPPTATPDFDAILATRHDLQLGLHQLRLAGEIAEIRAADLRFSERETRELLDASAGHTRPLHPRLAVADPLDARPAPLVCGAT